jgi:hypothetical protein
MNLKSLLAGSLVLAWLAGCGMQPGTTPAVRVSGSSGSMLSRAEAAQIELLNDGEELEELDDVLLEEVDPDAETFTAQGGLPFSGKSTRIGQVRSAELGKFFLQTSTGLIRKKEESYRLVGESEKLNLKISRALNQKVLVRGGLSPGQMTATTVWRVPDMGVLLDIMRTGCLKGQVYDSSTMTGLKGATVLARSVTTGQYHRATTGTNGAYKIRRMPPGEYQVSIVLGGYGLQVPFHASVKARKAGEALIPVSLNPAPGLMPLPMPGPVTR